MRPALRRFRGRVARPRVDQDARLFDAELDQRRLHLDRLVVGGAARVDVRAGDEDERGLVRGQILRRHREAIRGHRVHAGLRDLRVERGVSGDDEQRERVAVPVLKRSDLRDDRGVVRRARIRGRDGGRDRDRLRATARVGFDPLHERVVGERVGEAQEQLRSSRSGGAVDRVLDRARLSAGELCSEHAAEDAAELLIRAHVGGDLEIVRVVEGVVPAHPISRSPEARSVRRPSP